MSDPNKPFDWAGVIAADISNESADGNNRKPISPGLYAATITEVKYGLSKGGALGVTFTYQINGGAEDKRKVREGVYLTKKTGEPIGFAGQKLKRRMLACGLSPEQVTNFKYPKNTDSLGDFKLLFDSEVTIETNIEAIREGEMKGVEIARVTKVYRRAAADAVAVAAG